MLAGDVDDVDGDAALERRARAALAAAAARRSPGRADQPAAELPSPRLLAGGERSVRVRRSLLRSPRVDRAQRAEISPPPGYLDDTTRAILDSARHSSPDSRTPRTAEQKSPQSVVDIDAHRRILQTYVGNSPTTSAHTSSDSSVDARTSNASPTAAQTHSSANHGSDSRSSWSLGLETAVRAAAHDLFDRQVRKTPSWPRSWANFSLANFSLSYLCSHRNAWANLHLLGQPNIFLAI